MNIEYYSKAIDIEDELTITIDYDCLNDYYLYDENLVCSENLITEE